MKPTNLELRTHKFGEWRDMLGRGRRVINAVQVGRGQWRWGIAELVNAGE